MLAGWSASRSPLVKRLYFYPIALKINISKAYYLTRVLTKGFFCALFFGGVIVFGSSPISTCSVLLRVVDITVLENDCGGGCVFFYAFLNLIYLFFAD